MTINQIQDQIIEEFSIFNDWMDKYSYVIDLANDIPQIELAKKTDENLINGCQSKVWLDAKIIDDKLQFFADSDAIITKGIISLLIRVLTNQSPEDIINSDLYFLEKIGLKENLSPNRSNGLLAMIKQMKMYALAYNQKLKEA